MYEIINVAKKVTSVAILIGRGICNARCEHCAGEIHRLNAPHEDGVVDEKLIKTILRKCFLKGARSLSISGSGEPTLSPKAVTKTLKIAAGLREEGVDYSFIHLYSNGIRFGESEEFVSRYLPLWKSLGLRAIYITVHDVGPEKNAEAYGVKKYPNLATVVKRIHSAGMAVRANLVLCKSTICTFESFSSSVAALAEMGFDAISAWPIRDPDKDQVDRSKSPDEIELEKMFAWTACSRLRIPVRVLLEKERNVYQNRHKLTLLPDGTLSNSWCK